MPTGEQALRREDQIGYFPPGAKEEMENPYIDKNQGYTISTSGATEQKPVTVTVVFATVKVEVTEYKGHVTVSVHPLDN